MTFPSAVREVRNVRQEYALGMVIHAFYSRQCFSAQVSLKYTSQAGVRPSMRPSVHVSNMIISTSSRPFLTIFYPKHHWGGGKAALGFRPDRIETLVSMETDSSNRVIMGKISLALYRLHF